MSELPRRVRERVQSEEWTERSLERATAPPKREPENESPGEALTRRWREQAEAEQRHEDRVRRAMFEDPSPPADDPLRAFAASQRARRRRLKRLPR